MVARAIGVMLVPLSDVNVMICEYVTATAGTASCNSRRAISWEIGCTSVTSMDVSKSVTVLISLLTAVSLKSARSDSKADCAVLGKSSVPSKVKVKSVTVAVVIVAVLLLLELLELLLFNNIWAPRLAPDEAFEDLSDFGFSLRFLFLTMLRLCSEGRSSCDWGSF